MNTATLLKGAGTVESFPRHDFVNATAGSTYVGAETCKNCHPNTYMKWSTTKHAQAFTALLNDPKPNTIYDAECVTCHTTGFEYTSGYRSQTATPLPEGKPVRELPRAGVEARVRPRQRRVSQTAQAHRRDELTRTSYAFIATMKTTRRNLTSPPSGGRSLTRGSTTTRIREFDRGITPKVARTPADAAGK